MASTSGSSAASSIRRSTGSKLRRDGYSSTSLRGDGRRTSTRPARSCGRVWRRPVGIAQVVETRQKRELHERRETRRAVDPIDFLAASGGGDLLDHPDEVARRVRAEFQPHGVGEAAGGEHFLHFAGEVDGVLLLDGDVAVAGDAERGGGGDVFAGEKLARRGWRRGLR